MLAAQGVSEIIKHIAVMRGLLPEPSVSGGHTPEASAATTGQGAQA
jgi:TRAP-type mannitol/chloroaromatic compound transport system permease small subunit